MELKRSERNYGIDLLRICSMFMVALLHVLWQGGILFNTQPQSVAYWLAWFLESAAFCAVNCYGLISGYVGVNGTHRISSIATTWLQVLYYTVGITALFALLLPETTAWKELMGAFFPVIKDYYWYFTAYFVLFFFQPLLNHCIRTLNEKTLRTFCISVFVLFSVLPILANRDLFGLKEGYSPLWLGALYLLGGCIGKYGWFSSIKRWQAALIYFGSITGTWGWKFLTETLNMTAVQKWFPAGILYNYVSPTVMISALSLLILFQSWKEMPKFPRAIVGFLSPTAFSVYLIHVHPKVWYFVMHERFAPLTRLSTLSMVGGILLSALGIYLTCTLLDLPRHYLFRWLKVKKRLGNAEKALSEKIRRKNGTP